MKRKFSAILALMLLARGLVGESQAQTVPASVTREITSLLKDHDVFCDNSEVTISIESVKITPRKFGYIGTCRYGGGPSVLFEKKASGFQKLLAVDVGMNGYFYKEKTIHNGYYDFSHSERGGNEVSITTYQWNGTRYVAGKERTMRVP